MNKEEETENLYQQLLKRNQINFDIIRKFIKKSKLFKRKEELEQTKEELPEHPNHINHNISQEFECPTGAKEQMLAKSTSKQSNSNSDHRLSENNTEKINKAKSRFPLINSLHFTNKTHQEQPADKEVSLSHYHFQEQNIKNCEVSESNNSENVNEYPHDHQIRSNTLKMNKTEDIDNQKFEIVNKIEDKKGTKDLKQIVNMKELKFEVPNNQEKCKENSILKSKDRNKPKQSNSLLSYSFQNKKYEYPGFYANSETGIFDSIDSITNMFDSAENTNKLTISREGSNQQKAISSISFSAISYLIGNAGKLGINNLEEKGIEGEKYIRNWREKYGLEESNRSSIMQIGDLLSLYPTKESGPQSKHISEKTNILMANINKLKEFKLNFHKMAKEEKIPKSQGYRNISSNSVSLPMTNSMHENEKNNEYHDMKFKKIGRILNKI